MPPSSEHTIEIALKLQNTEPVEDTLTKIAKTSDMMADSIRSGFEKVQTFIANAVKALPTTLSKVRSGVDREFLANLSLTNAWVKALFGGIIESIKENQPEFLRTIHQNYLIPAVQFVRKTRDDLAEIGGYIAVILSNAFQSGASSVKTSLTSSLASYLTQAKKYFQDTFENFQKQHPYVAFAVEGVWRAGKLAVLGFLATALRVPSALTAITSTSIKVIKTASSIIANVKRATLESYHLLKSYSLTAWGITKQVGNIIGKITGISLALKAAHKFTKFALTVTGIGVALSTVRKFFAGAKNESAGLLAPLQVLTDVIETALAPISEQLYILAVELSSVLANVLTPFFQAVGQIVKTVVQSFREMVHTSGVFGSGLSTIKEIIGDFSKLLIGAAQFLIKDVLPLLFPILSALLSAAKEFAGVLMPMFTELGGTLGPAIRNFIKEIIPAIIPVIKNIATLLVTTIQALAKGLVPLFENLEKALPKLIPVIQDLVMSIADLVIALTPILVMVVDLFVVKLLFILPPVVKILIFIIKLLTGLVSWITVALVWAGKFSTEFLNIFKSLTSNIGGFFSTLTSITTFVFGGLINFIKNAWSELSEFLGFETLVTGITGIFETILGSVTAVLTSIKGIINAAIIDPLRTVITSELPVIGASIGNLFGLEPPEYFARGGVVTRPIIMGEAGNEVILPLKREIIREIIPEFIKTEVPPFPAAAIPRVSLSMPGVIKIDDDTTINRTIIKILSSINANLDKALTQKDKRVDTIKTAPQFDFTMTGFVVS